uniref:BTB domain-containing protein n=1 Tax=Panagrolaimus sp. ES5 TaxID=591445 RepID=A0AC34GVJ3_9BILA
MIWKLDKKAVKFGKFIFDNVSKFFWDVPRNLVLFIFVWPLFLIAFLQLLYNFINGNNFSFTLAICQFVLLIVLFTQFKYQLISNTEQYLSNVKIIKIKVGKEKFEEKAVTCKKYATFFEILKNSAIDRDGYVLLQRDSTHFEKILQYLKNCNVKFPYDVKTLKNISQEAIFFGLPELAQKCNIKNSIAASKNWKIKVGDQYFELKLEDIRAHEGFYNFLINCKIDENGNICIPLEETDFSKIKEYIETGDLDPKTDLETRKRISVEAQSYGLTELVEICDARKYLLSLPEINIKMADAIFPAKVDVCKKFETFYNKLKSCKIDDENCFVLHRDATNFEKIINYMETGVFEQNNHFITMDRVATEARYYGLWDLYKLCNVREYLLTDCEHINVKVGNTKYKLDSTICKKNNTFYENLKNCHRTSDGCFVVQRDEKHFDKIWNYMKSGEISLNTDVDTMREISYEAKHYGLTDLVHKCENYLKQQDRTAAAFSRSIFNKAEKQFVIATGAPIVFLEFGFLGVKDLELNDEGLKQIAKGFIDFMKVRNNKAFDDYFLITDFTIPVDKNDHKIGLSFYFNGISVADAVDIYNSTKRTQSRETLTQLISTGCLELAHSMRRSVETTKIGSRQLTILPSNDLND